MSYYRAICLTAPLSNYAPCSRLLAARVWHGAWRRCSRQPDQTWLHGPREPAAIRTESPVPVLRGPVSHGSQPHGSLPNVNDRFFLGSDSSLLFFPIIRSFTYIKVPGASIGTRVSIGLGADRDDDEGEKIFVSFFEDYYKPLF